MVTLTEVQDEHFQSSQMGPEADDEDFTDTGASFGQGSSEASALTSFCLDSEISNESDFDPSSETLAERLYALRDMIPPTTRGWVSSRVSSFSAKAWSVLSFGGKGAWVITTSALFFGVPFALSFAEDQQLTAMEQEYNMRQTGSELLTAGSDQSTAEKVGAALGDAKPQPA